MAGKNSFRLAMRGRNINPKIYQNYELADAECDTKLPLFKFLTGLWCYADKEGRFSWDLRKLQINIFPFHPQTDILAMLDILVKQDVVRKYEVKGKQYGWLVRFRYYQYLAKKEPTSLFPPHPEDTPDADQDDPDDNPTVIGSESDSPENALVVDACRLITDGRCTKVDADARRLKTEVDHAPEGPQLETSVKHANTILKPFSQSQLSVQVSEEPERPVKAYFKLHPEQMRESLRPCHECNNNPKAPDKIWCQECLDKESLIERTYPSPPTQAKTLQESAPPPIPHSFVKDICTVCGIHWSERRSKGCTVVVPLAVVADSAGQLKLTSSADAKPKPITALAVRRLWDELTAGSLGKVGNEELFILIRPGEHNEFGDSRIGPEKAMEVLRWAHGTSKYWFKKGKGEILNFNGFCRAFESMRKQYENYREAIEHTNDTKWQACHAIEKELEEEQRMFDRGRAAAQEMEIPYR
jgi:hypothetical protein